jgi:hypothetical protein
MSDIEENELDDMQTFSLKILKSHWSGEQETEVRGGLEALFEDCKLCFCKNCRLLFCPRDGDECVVRTHRGKQIAFPNGRMEETARGPEGETVTLRNFTCCGKCADGEGCVEKAFGTHVPDPNRVNSTLRITEQPVHAPS